MMRLVDGPVLGLETSGTLTGAALILRGRLAGEVAFDVRAGSQELLSDLVRLLLERFRLEVADLARLGVALGPGSFTGLRVGLAAARALAVGAGIPLVGVPSHQSLAWPWQDDGRTLVLLTGARRGQVYLEAGRWREDSWVAAIPAASVQMIELASLLGRLSGSGPLLFLGEATEAALAACPELAALGGRVSEPLASVRRPAGIAMLAARSSAATLQGPELDRLEPLYLRGADARRPGA
jgi:tRNA threonylcarbamoyladenosine biosynthesis protein TsaB